MNKIATITEPAHSASTLSEAELYYRDKLREMTDIGSMLLRMLFSDAAAMRKALKGEADSATFPLPDQSDAYDTYCRAMRRNMMFDRSLDQPAPKPVQPIEHRGPTRVAAPVAEAEPAEPAEPSDVERAEPIERLMERPEPPEPAERPETIEDISGQPIGKVVTAIGRDWAKCEKFAAAPSPAPAKPPTRTPAQTQSQQLMAMLRSVRETLDAGQRHRGGDPDNTGPPPPNIRR